MGISYNQRLLLRILCAQTLAVKMKKIAWSEGSVLLSKRTMEQSHTRQRWCDSAFSKSLEGWILVLFNIGQRTSILDEIVF
jgi:hypothetical protein